MKGMTASSLKSWFEKEFCGESKNVLEAPHNSCGMAFIDDFHFDNTTVEPSVDRSSHPEHILKAILEGTPLSTMKKKTKVRSSANFGYHEGSTNGGYERFEGTFPILHKEMMTDPRNHSSMIDDYILQRITVLSTANCNISDIMKFDNKKSILSKYCVVGLPLMSHDELHVAMISGVNAGLRFDSFDTRIVDLLENEIFELCKFTSSISNKLSAYMESSLPTKLEKLIGGSIRMSLMIASQLSLSAKYGSSGISNPGGLLQMFAHEWKRLYLDPFQVGATKEKILTIIKEQLDTIDETGDALQ